MSKCIKCSCGMSIDFFKKPKRTIISNLLKTVTDMGSYYKIKYKGFNGNFAIINRVCKDCAPDGYMQALSIDEIKHEIEQSKRRIEYLEKQDQVQQYVRRNTELQDIRKELIETEKKHYSCDCHGNSTDCGKTGQT